MKNKFFYYNTYLRFIMHPLFIVAWFGFAIISYFYFDQAVALYMHHLAYQSLVKQAGQFFTNFGWGTYYIIVSFLVFLLTRFIWKKPKLAGMALFFFLAVVITGLCCDAFKIILGRTRPVELFDLHLYGFYFFDLNVRYWSFPSGHSTTIAAVMTALSLRFPRIWPLGLLMMLLVAASRVVVTAHFVSDVMAGLYLGSVLTIFIGKWCQNKGWLELPILNGVSLAQDNPRQAKRSTEYAD